MRLNSRQRDAWWDRVAYRELELGLPVHVLGEFCRGCCIPVSKHRGGPHPVGYIDCIDNSGDHSRLENLQLLCPGCNRYKNLHRLAVAQPRDLDDTRTATLKLNLREKYWRMWVIGVLIEKGKMSVDHAMIGGAEKFALGPTTLKRYLSKIQSVEGPAPGKGTILILRPDFEEWAEKRAEWNKFLEGLDKQ